ncbi:hypothetical protein VN24_07895 [Paenibacillus beijingensis]|uniref:Flagellar hook-associated protein 2 n=2 Tax=Paenibacillus beijingensis TaxID=1126833 RepID=A0A0D5NQP6_9BACL|nr:hypothetical protein VN24_07895 [Paenibacillus beijingensis]
MVKTLMKAENSKLDKLKQKQTTINWQQEAYRDVSTSLVDFRNNKLAKYNTATSMSARTSEVTGNTSSVSVTSTSSAANGSLSVTVGSLATAANTMVQLNGAPIDSSKTMGNLGLFVQDSGSSDPDSGKLTIGGADIVYNKNDTLSGVLAKINADKGANVTAMLDSQSGLLSITSNTTGNKSITISGMGGITSSAVTAGEDAQYKVNGLSMKSASNNVTVNGFSLQLKAESGSSGASTITSKVDTDSILNTIKSFITDYNSVLDQVNGKLNEQRYRSFTPLSDAQKADMKESEVELWEKKARSGLISDDTILSSMISDMRVAAVAVVSTGDSSITNIQSVGINTGKWNEYGKLVIEDESKLRQSIEQNPDAVMALFTAKGSDSSPASSDTGLFNKLSDTVMSSLQRLSEKAGTSSYSTDKSGAFIASSMLSEQVRDLQKRIDNMNSYLMSKENQYYKQFTAMETAINRYSSQSSAFSGNM